MMTGLGYANGPFQMGELILMSKFSFEINKVIHSLHSVLLSFFFFSQRYHRAVANPNTFVFTPPYLDALGGGFVVSLSKEILFDVDKRFGVLGMDLTLNNLWVIIEKLYGSICNSVEINKVRNCELQYCMFSYRIKGLNSKNLVNILKKHTTLFKLILANMFGQILVFNK